MLNCKLALANFLNFQKNIYSQNGEDGIIEEIFNRLGSSCSEEKWCVEFGAWNGNNHSNTFNLVEQKRWKAVYIEGCQNKYKDLIKVSEKYKSIVAINAYVSHLRESTQTLDKILSKIKMPQNYDLLSIHVDSYDLAIWNIYTGKPKVVIIEVNSSIKAGILQWHNIEKKPYLFNHKYGLVNGKLQGNSFSSTLSVAKEKGYTLICHVGNLIFVRNDLVHLLGLDKDDIQFPERLFNDLGIQLESQTFFELIKLLIKKIFKKLRLIKKP